MIWISIAAGIVLYVLGYRDGKMSERESNLDEMNRLWVRQK